ncbi:MAG: hypothetical protein D6788_06515 [Planctomycetota bacterium]|nr:MAG: hypothetical protein D6788_06515 [Planctomycetota bacterium]
MSRDGGQTKETATETDEKPLRSAKHRTRKRFRTALVALVAALGIGGIGLWSALSYKPSWYEPLSLDAEAEKRVRMRVVARLDEIGDRLVEGHAFEIVLDEREVNEWLTVLPDVWPEIRDDWPAQLTHPVIRFETDRIRLGAHWMTPGWQSIIQLTVRPTLTDGGRRIRIDLVDAGAGALPLPGFALRRIARAWNRRHGSEAAPDSRETLSNNRHPLRTTVRNLFRWFNGKRPFRIEAVTVRPGTLHLRLEPL